MRRGVAAALAVVVVGVGLAVHRWAPGSAASDVAGDALYAVLIYALVVVVAPRAAAVWVAVIAGAWCVAVEVLQLTGLPAAAAAVFPPVALVLGTGFDPRDLLVYVVAVALAALSDAAIRARRRRG